MSIHVCLTYKHECILFLSCEPVCILVNKFSIYSCSRKTDDEASDININISRFMIFYGWSTDVVVLFYVKPIFYGSINNKTINRYILYTCTHPSYVNWELTYFWIWVVIIWDYTVWKVMGVCVCVCVETTDYLLYWFFPSSALHDVHG